MASADDLLMEVGDPGTATTLSAPGYTAGNTSINVGSTTNWPTATGVTFAIDQAEVVNNVEVQVPGSYNEFVGTVDTGTSITNVDWVRGAGDTNYAAGPLTRVYIPVSAERENRIVEWGLVHADQDGTLKSGAVDVAAVLASNVVTTAKIIDGAITNAKLSTTAGELGGAYQTWTPSLFAGNFGTGATVSAKYHQTGKKVKAYLKATVNSTSLNMGVVITPPVAAATSYQNVPCGVALYFDTSATQYFQGTVNVDASGNIQARIIVNATSGRADPVSNSNPFAWATGDIFAIAIEYEAA